MQHRCSWVMGPLLLLSAISIGSPRAAWAETVRLPEIGTKRRVVLAEFRQAGMVLLEGAGNRLEFVGGPAGLADAATTSCRFEGLDLVELRLDFAQRRDERWVDFYEQIARRLSQAYGKPCQRNAASARPLVTRWCREDQALTLRGEGTGDLSLLVGRQGASRAETTVWRAGEGNASAAWSPGQFENELTRAKQAVEDLLHDLGSQPFWAAAAKHKGAPLDVRLKQIEVRGDLQGLDEDMLRLRFLYFARGHWEINMVTRRPEVDIDLEVVPALRGGGQVYLMRLVARVAKGKNRGRVLFSGAREL